MAGERQPSEDQRDRAALWLARRAGGSMSSADEVALREWLEEDPLNRVAFEEAQRTWAELDAPSRRAARAQARRGEGGRLRGRALQVAGAALVALFLVWFLDPSLFQDWRADVVSGRTNVTQVILPDGSLARLGADTALALDFDDTRRHVDLLRGEAYFEVVPGSSPPFTVAAGGDAIQVVGTGFDVMRANAATTVTVAHGKVAVVGASHGAVDLERGTRVRVESGRTKAPEPADIDAALSWMKGRLTVRQVPLADLAARFERHGGGRILLTGSLSHRRVSGTFPLDDVDGSLDTVAAAVGARVLHLPPWITVLY